MPISGGPPGLTFAFEREVESVPGVGTLVIGDSKIISSMEATGSAVEMEKMEAAVWTALHSLIAAQDIVANVDPMGGYFLSIEAANFRLSNTNAAARNVYMSVINVG